MTKNNEVIAGNPIVLFSILRSFYALIITTIINADARTTERRSDDLDQAHYQLPQGLFCTPSPLQTYNEKLS